MEVLREWHMIVVLGLLCSVVYYVIKLNNKWQKLPRGPFALPVIGNLHNLAGKPPHISLRDLAEKYGPAFFMRMGSVPTLVISNHEWARLLFKTHDAAFSGRPKMLTGETSVSDSHNLGFFEHGDEWKLTQKLFSELIGSSRIKTLTNMREEEVSFALKNLWELSEHGSCVINLSETLHRFQHNTLWRSICGNSIPHMYSKIGQLTSKISDAMVKRSVGGIIPLLGWLDFGAARRQTDHALAEFGDFVDKLLKERGDQQTKSFVDLLLDAAQLNPHITPKHIKSIILGITMGGNETISVTLEWTVSLLLKNPKYMRKVQQEIDQYVSKYDRVKEKDIGRLKWLKCVVKEAMRLYPIGPIAVPRECVETVNINGYLIPKGTMIVFNIWALGRDPKVWENSETFNPERFINQDDVDLAGWSDFNSLPFGAGRRACPGYNIANTTILIMLASLLHAFDIFLHGDPAALDMSENVGHTLSKKKPLFVHIRPRTFSTMVYLT